MTTKLPTLLLTKLIKKPARIPRYMQSWIDEKVLASHEEDHDVFQDNHDVPSPIELTTQEFIHTPTTTTDELNESVAERLNSSHNTIHTLPRHETNLSQQWVATVVDNLRKELQTPLPKRATRAEVLFFQYTSAISPELFATSILSELARVLVLANDPIPLLSTASKIGRSIMELKQLAVETPHYDPFPKVEVSSTTLLDNEVEDIDTQIENENLNAITLGYMTLDRLMAWLRVGNDELALQQTSMYVAGKKLQAHIVVHDEVKRYFAQAFSHHGESDIVHMDSLGGIFLEHMKFAPISTPPRPWSSMFSGGYFKHAPTFNLRMVRSSSPQHTKMLKMLNPRSAPVLFHGLNAIQEVAWTCNQEIVKMAQYKFSVGGSVSSTLPRQSLMDLYKERQAILREQTKNMRKARLAAKQQGESFNKMKQDVVLKITEPRLNTNQSAMSKRLNAAVTFGAVAAMQDKPFYFAYNLDFRGRAYPMSNYPSPTGSDLSRGLLLFHKKKMLGQHGMYWLLVHLGNLMGKSKLSSNERVEWAMQNMERICDRNRDSAYLWCQQFASNPLQAWATVTEIYNAMNSPNVHEFASGLPIHQDGSCNGLQHYAAMSRDANGGAKVNLTPGERPSDVYSELAVLVQQMADNDADEFHNRIANLSAEERKRFLHMFALGKSVDKELSDCFFGMLLRGVVSRKLVKQTVMTSVYGVTMIGAKEQIQKRLVELDEVAKIGTSVTEWTQMSDTLIGPCALYAAKKTMDAIKTTFEGASKTMAWLKLLATEVGKFKEPIIFLSPLGLPVLQPYVHGSQEVNYRIQSHRVSLATGGPGPADAIKQKTAFPPNFVHNLDSSHLLMTAKACAGQNITFAAVHDSYWTHAADVHEMGTILREQFVKLHEIDLLNDLRDQVIARHPQLENVLELPPARGTLDLNEVLKSEYFFN